MATTYSDIATNQQDTTKAKDLVVDGSKVSGVLMNARAKITLPASYTADDIVNLVRLPAGSVVRPELSRVYAQNPGTALVADIGDDDELLDGTDNTNADRYSDGLTLSAGGSFGFNDGGTEPEAATTPYRLNRQSWIQATIKTATSLTVDQEIVVDVVYSAAV